MDKIKLFIVDDEPMSVEYLKSLLAQEAQYEIVGEAYDGLTAYEMIRKKNPDIVFADISMPVMDGLELAEKLLPDNKTIKVILLTSYRDFDYARKGLRLGVSSYLLKHQISNELLIQEIEAAMEKVKANRSTERKLLQFNLRKFLLSGENPEQELTECLYHRGEEFLLMTVVPNLPFWQEEQAEIPKPKGWERFENTERKGLRCRGVIEMEQGQWTALLFLPSGQSQRLRRELLAEFAVRMQEEFRNSGCPASVIVSDTTANFYHLPALYPEHWKAVERCYQYKKNSVLFQNEMGREAGCKANMPDNVSVTLLERMELGEQAAADWIGEVMRQSAAGLLCKEFKGLVMEIANVADFFAQREKLSCTSGLSGTCYDAAEAESLLLEKMHGIFYCMEVNRNSGRSAVTRNAIFYMEENYPINISLQDIAENCKVSESSLRKRFKQETGKTAVDYLTELRIEKAKKLLRDENCRVVEVYREVGFTSSQYFCSVFKKVEGTSPSEYRNRCLERHGVYNEQKKH